MKTTIFNNAIFCTNLKKLPAEDHYAIIEFDSIFVPGDERSRTNPGHGYPDSYEDTVKYRAFLSREDWEAAIAEMHFPKYGPAKTNFAAVFVKRPKVELIVKTSVNVEF